MRNLIHRFILILFFALPLQTLHANPNQQKLQNLVDSYAVNQGFSGTVLLARGDRILVHSSYGQANKEWDVANTPSTIYRLGSISKPFTATLVMKLAKDGLLSLDGNLGQYLPELYAGTSIENVTVEQLLSHTSGIKDFPGNVNDPWWQTTARQSYEPENFAREWIKPVLIEESGSKWRYNNSGFILLGLIIEKVTKKPYIEAMREHIFEPAGMKNSGLFNGREIIPNLASAYSRTPDGGFEQPFVVDPSILFSAGSLYSNAMDIYRFDRALYKDNIIGTKTRKNMMSVKAQGPYGFGWGVEEWTLSDNRKLPIASHTGSIPGYQSYYLRSEPNQDFIFIMNNNNYGAIVLDMGNALMRALNGEEVPLAKRKLEDLIMPIALKQGSEAMITAYENLSDERSQYSLTPRNYIALGYKLLGLKKVDEAILVFQWSVSDHPNHANSHDSLGEAYRINGQLDKALSSYEKAVMINPKMDSAKKAVTELRAEINSD